MSPHIYLSPSHYNIFSFHFDIQSKLQMQYDRIWIHHPFLFFRHTWVIILLPWLIMAPLLWFTHHPANPSYAHLFCCCASWLTLFLSKHNFEYIFSILSTISQGILSLYYIWTVWSSEDSAYCLKNTAGSGQSQDWHPESSDSNTHVLSIIARCTSSTSRRWRYL